MIHYHMRYWQMRFYRDFWSLIKTSAANDETGGDGRRAFTTYFRGVHE